MKAIILAAGRGSRMEGLTDDRPKCLVELVGRTLLERQMSALRAAGIKDIAVVRGYLGDHFEPFGLTLFDNRDWQTTNMVASLRCASRWLTMSDCIVSYSDIFYSPATVARLVSSTAPIAIAYDPNWRSLWERRFADPLTDAETFRLDAAGELVDIGRRPQNYEEIEGQYMGLLRFTPVGWKSVTNLLDGLDGAVTKNIDMTSMIGRLIATGVAVKGIAIGEAWGEVDSASDLAAYEKMVAVGDSQMSQLLK